MFVEAVFDNHIDWTKITNQSDNYKRPLQELLQSEFKTTPHIMEIESFTQENGYHMGVYLCLGQSTHGIHHNETMSKDKINSFQQIHEHMAYYQKIFLFLGNGQNKTKINAEQMACRNAIEYLKSLKDFAEVIEKVQQKHSAFT